MKHSVVFLVLIALITWETQLSFTLEVANTISQPKFGADCTSKSACRSRAKHFLVAKVQNTTKGTSTFQIERKLLVCGDVSPNPGPKTTNSKSKYPCGECARIVRKNQDAILCVRINVWSHAKCLHLSKSSFQYYMHNPEMECTCALCSRPNFSDSYFDEYQSEVDTTSMDDLSAGEEAQVDMRHVRDNNKKQCIIASLNINSLPNKFVEIKEWLRSDAFDILSVQETKIDHTFPSTQFHVDSYNLFRRDRVKGGGGIAVYIRDSIATLCKKHTGRHLESILFDLQIGQRQFALISAYKPPSSDNITFTSEWTTLLDEATCISENVICVGDLNCDIINPLPITRNHCGR